MRVQQRNGNIILNADKISEKRTLPFRQAAVPGGFSFEFSVSREIYEPTSKINVTIFNPNDETIESVQRNTLTEALEPFENRPTVLIQAGYGNNLATVAAGTIYFSRVVHMGNDKRFIIQASTLSNKLRTKKVVLNSDASTTFGEVISTITRDVQELVINKLPQSLLSLKGAQLSLNATIIDALRTVNNLLKISFDLSQGFEPFFIYPGPNGTIILSPSVKPNKILQYTFNTNTGLLQAPTRENWTFIRFESKFNPFVSVEDWVRLDSDTIKTDGMITQIAHNWQDKDAMTIISISPDGQPKAINPILI